MRTAVVYRNTLRGAENPLWRLKASLKMPDFAYHFRDKETDTGLKEVAGLKGLQALGLGRTEVTDKGLKALAGASGLQALDLRQTQVTDAGLKELAGLKSLQLLDLRVTKVTDGAWKALQRTLPGCTISRY
jgi:hypothetical protein